MKWIKDYSTKEKLRTIQLTFTCSKSTTEKLENGVKIIHERTFDYRVGKYVRKLMLT